MSFSTPAKKDGKVTGFAGASFTNKGYGGKVEVIGPDFAPDGKIAAR